MSKIFGIDVSLWQKGFNFAKAKDEGVKFVIIKASQSDYADPQFENHYKAAKAAGLHIGAYHYLKATSEEEAKAHAKYMIENCLKGKTFEYPIFVDVEDKVLRLGRTKLDPIVKAFCNTLEAAGYWAGIYCNYDFYKNQFSGPELSERYSLWLAAWDTGCPTDCQMWQFGGETNKIRTNKVAGVVCDQNYAFKDFPSEIKKKGLNGFKKSSAAETKQPAAKTSYLQIGDIVSLEYDAPIWNSENKFQSWVYKSDLYVRSINGDRVVISTQKTGAVTGAVHKMYLKRV